MNMKESCFNKLLIGLKKITTKIKIAILSILTDFIKIVNRLENQEQLIHKAEWDTLIVLDACRFDYFKKEYKNFLYGKLKAVFSPASDTYGWLKNVFNKWYDYSIYSAHPVLNSKGIERYGYLAKNHFAKIYDIWDTGWQEEIGTVPPEEVNKVVLRNIKEGKFKGKNIIWYIQPHAPWIGKTKIAGLGEPFAKDIERDLGTIWEDIRKGNIKRSVLIQAYRDNLIRVLQCVAELIPHLSGTIVVTADHGELLGEFGLFRHPPDVKVLYLRLVPWLEIRK